MVEEKIPGGVVVDQGGHGVLGEGGQVGLGIGVQGALTVHQGPGEAGDLPGFYRHHQVVCPLGDGVPVQGHMDQAEHRLLPLPGALLPGAAVLAPPGLAEH